jgi:hypothetical protein
LPLPSSAPSLMQYWNRFDEVHFGKFAAYYILREYYFDVHPPFAKLLLGLAGWFVGFDGKFEFEAIGDSYSEHHIPYMGMRSMPAIFGSITVTIVYQIMKECGFPVVVCSFTALLIAIGEYRGSGSMVLSRELRVFVDNGHICQTRLILLDAALVFFVALSLYAYVRFRKVRYLYVCSSPIITTHSLTQTAASSLANGGDGCALPAFSLPALLGARWSAFSPSSRSVLAYLSISGTLLISASNTPWCVIRISPRFVKFLKAYIGTCLEALLRTRSWSYRFAVLGLSLVLLGSLQSLISFGDRRPFHEPCIPRVSARQRALAQGAWYAVWS